MLLQAHASRHCSFLAQHSYSHWQRLFSGLLLSCTALQFKCILQTLYLHACRILHITPHLPCMWKAACASISHQFPMMSCCSAILCPKSISSKLKSWQNFIHRPCEHVTSALWSWIWRLGQDLAIAMQACHQPFVHICMKS